MPATLGPTLADEDEGASQTALEPSSPFLFVLLEADRPEAGGTRHQLTGLRSVSLGRASERRATRAHGELVLRIPDGRLSHEHARLTLVRGRWVLEDAGSRNGTRVDGEPVRQVPLCDGALIEVGRTFLLFREALPRSERADLDCESDQVATLHPALEAEFGKLRRVAASVDVPILIQGESGTGKEVLAHQILEWSGRTGPFVAVNCGALVENLVESQLFGSTRGAFSGATVDRIGFVRSADHGCLFLDEIAELPLGSQAALLRVLEEREVVPVGGTKPVRVDIRVLAATHQDLDARVRDERFRRDLLARLSGFRIQLPPLRERLEDFGLLVRSLLQRSSDGSAPLHFTPEAVRALLTYSWSLNVRELAHTLTTAALLAKGGLVEVSDLPEPVRSGRALEPAPDLGASDVELRAQLVDLLAKHRGNVSAVARDMGKARMQIQRWLKRFRIDAEAYRE
jgi:DNA-binding NtrC family response regulator